MSERMVVHSTADDADPEAEVTRRLRVGGIEIIEQQPRMLLVSGKHHEIANALGNARGWNISALTTMPPPRKRERVLKGPR